MACATTASRTRRDPYRGQGPQMCASQLDSWVYGLARSAAAAQDPAWPHPLQNRGWMFFFPCRSRAMPFVEVKEGGTMMAAKGRMKIFPFLWYAKEAEEAAKFYASIFPDSRVDRVTAMPREAPSGPPGSVKVVDFTLFGQRFQAMTAGPHQEFNDAISMVVLCEDQAELDR